MQLYVREEVSLNPGTRGWSPSRSGRFISEKRVPDTNSIRESIGPRADLDVVMKNLLDTRIERLSLCNFIK